MNEAQQAIADMEAMRLTHVEWAEHFEKHPELEAQYVATGEWDSAEKHREIVAQYDRVIRYHYKRSRTEAVTRCRPAAVLPTQRRDFPTPMYRNYKGMSVDIIQCTT